MVRERSVLFALPPYFGELIGRAAELAAIRRALCEDHVRLLTLAGSAGIGKTSLALAAGHEVRSAFRHGVWFINLARINDPELVPVAIIDALGMAHNPILSTMAQLHQHLQDRELLLLLDNFEHVLPAAPLVGELLASHPDLSVLVTSRRPLRLKWEHALTVAGFASPGISETQDV